mmetsp:Transcript_6795/g.12218  ORF Transcript_6795/g.12218 Transcript_6795/m.12218 type:complete len:352 (+) Transcript_6795:42-1097(+)
MKSIPIIDIDLYVTSKPISQSEVPPPIQQSCESLASSLIQYGAVIIQDSRVNATDNDKYITMMQKYFDQPREIKVKDARPDLSYQVGVTPDGIEKARDHTEYINKRLDEENKPHPLSVSQAADPKWRFFWRLYDQERLGGNAINVVPKAFEQEWASTMNGWGYKMLQAVYDATEMLALGLGMEADSLTQYLQGGNHLLAPTGSDLSNLTKDVVLAAFHYDLNFLTIHGAASHPGLFIWTREGKRLAVKVPKGCLLIQAGIQVEILTGGKVQRGFHEVIVTEDALTIAQNNKQLNKPCGVWRVSSTVFSHVASDKVLKPLIGAEDSEVASKYPPIRAEDQVRAELEAINLKA